MLHTKRGHQRSETTQTLHRLAEELACYNRLRFLPCSLHTAILPGKHIAAEGSCCRLPYRSRGAERCPQQDRGESHCPAPPSVLTGTRRG